MFKQFIDAMLCIPGEEGKSRISLTKTGAAIKSIPVYVGASLAGLTFFSGDQKMALYLAVGSAVVRGIGEWIEKAGERNAIK